jgi:hypothetical protein
MIKGNTMKTKMAVAAMLLSWPLIGSPRASAAGLTELAEGGDKPKKIMCSWIAYSRNEYMCLEGDMKEAQKKCDETATKMRGEPSKCKCTDDPNYIRDVCD